MKKQNPKKTGKRQRAIINHPPGTVLYSGKYTDEPTSIASIQYTLDDIQIKETIQSKADCKLTGPDEVQWIEITGFNHPKTLTEWGKFFGLTMLQLEDIVTVNQRPKMEEFDDGIFIVLKLAQLTPQGKLTFSHFSLLLSQQRVVSFQETESTLFDPLKERIKRKLGRIREGRADYLLYAILDIIIDNYYSAIENLSTDLEEIEDDLLSKDYDENTLEKIHFLKKEILKFARIARPIKDITNRLEKTNSPLIEKKTTIYIQDLVDHITQINEITENSREMVWSLMEIYMSGASNKMNEIMKVLTIMSSIFIPLTFIAGIYGMNFEFMPELHLKYGYYYSLGAMVIIVLLLIRYFKRKNWF